MGRKQQKKDNSVVFSERPHRMIFVHAQRCSFAGSVAEEGEYIRIQYLPLQKAIVQKQIYTDHPGTELSDQPRIWWAVTDCKGNSELTITNNNIIHSQKYFIFPVLLAFRNFSLLDIS